MRSSDDFKCSVVLTTNSVSQPVPNNPDNIIWGCVRPLPFPPRLFFQPSKVPFIRFVVIPFSLITGSLPGLFSFIRFLFSSLCSLFHFFILSEHSALHTGSEYIHFREQYLFVLLILLSLTINSVLQTSQIFI